MAKWWLFEETVHAPTESRMGHNVFMSASALVAMKFHCFTENTMHKPRLKGIPDVELVVKTANTLDVVEEGEGVVILLVDLFCSIYVVKQKVLFVRQPA